jgi:NDP-sugar pyrophosphorylase family protein
MKTVILAGGRGTRLAPYTSVLPKPLLPVGERAILEILVEQLRHSGFTDITLSVGHLAHLIRAVFENGPSRGVELDYVQEESPLGTAAPLRLVDGLDETFLVMNGDVLTKLDLRELVRYHHERGYEMTIASHERRTRFDYGVIQADDEGRVLAFSEKPEVTSLVSMGIYVMEPGVLDAIPEGTYFDFPDLVHALVGEGRSVGVYPYSGYWRDLGRHEDYAAANEEWENSSSPDGNLNSTEGLGTADSSV